jgi:hypothetical protein
MACKKTVNGYSILVRRDQLDPRSSSCWDVSIRVISGYDGIATFFSRILLRQIKCPGYLFLHLDLTRKSWNGAVSLPGLAALWACSI